MTVQVDLTSLMDEAKRKKIRIAPVKSNRASELGHPCLRYLVYLRTRWQERLPYDVSLQYIFDDGIAGEQQLLRELDEAGIRVIHQQKDPTWDKYNISGHIDGKIEDPKGRWIPMEIKTINPYDFLKINSIEDCHRSKKTWIRKIPGQINLYMLMENEEDGVIVLKSRGRPKQINVSLDYEYAESLLKKAEKIEMHIRENTLPDRTEDEKVHENCPFYHICLPASFNPGMMLDDPDLEAKLDRLGELKKYVDEFDELNSEIKSHVKEEKQIVIGNWIITGRWVEKKSFVAKAVRYLDVRIKPMKIPNKISEG